MNYYGNIDFTILCRMWKEHKEAFQMVDFKDGQHALLKVNLEERKEPDKHGNTHYLKAAVRKSEQKDNVSYYVGSNFRPSQRQSSSSSQEPEIPGSSNDLPF